MDIGPGIEKRIENGEWRIENGARAVAKFSIPNSQFSILNSVPRLNLDTRDTLFGDLHGLVLEVEVIEGLGAIVPFVMATDVGTQDVSVVVQ